MDKGKLGYLIKKLSMFKKLLSRAEDNIDVVMPVLHTFKCSASSIFTLPIIFFEMLQRDKNRINILQENINECPLGCGALVGTNFFEIDRFTS